MKPAMMLTFAAALLWPAALQAHSYRQGEIEIGHVWARGTAAGATTAAVYMPLRNAGKTPDALTAVTTPVADDAMIHESVTENGITGMHMLDALPLPPGKPVAMRPGGKHVMLTGLKRRLKDGETFPMKLRFEKAGEIAVEVFVEKAGAMQAGH